MLPQPDNSHAQTGDNNTRDNLRPLEIIMPLLRQVAGVELPFSDAVQQAVICLGKIGNTRRGQFAVEADVYDGFAELPAGCDQIDAVMVASTAPNSAADVGLSRINGLTYNASDGDFLSNEINGTGKVAVAPDQVAGFRSYRLPSGAGIDLSQYGERYQRYSFRDGGLYLGSQASPSQRVRAAALLDCAPGENEPGCPRRVRVFYSGVVCDHRGYPLITPEEALACAYFTLMLETQKRYFAKEATADQWQAARQISNQHVNQARIAPLSDNQDVDRMLDEGTRLHRHFFTDDLFVR